MTGVLLGVVVLLLVGLPLLALAAGRWLPSPRGRPGPPDPALVVARAHGVGGIDVIRVQEAVERGEQVVPALRPATIAWAEHVLGQGRWPWSALEGRRRQVVLGVVLVYPVFPLAGTVLQALDGRVGLPAIYLLLVVALVPFSGLGVRRRDARATAAIAANRDA